MPDFKNQPDLADRSKYVNGVLLMILRKVESLVAKTPIAVQGF